MHRPPHVALLALAVHGGAADATPLKALRNLEVAAASASCTCCLLLCLCASGHEIDPLQAEAEAQLAKTRKELGAQQAAHSLPDSHDRTAEAEFVAAYPKVAHVAGHAVADARSQGLRYRLHGPRASRYRSGQQQGVMRLEPHTPGPFHTHARQRLWRWSGATNWLIQVRMDMRVMTSR